MGEQRPERLLVLGAGITGLCAAYEALQRANRERRRVEVTVLEASNRVGGKVMTESRGGVLFELGPDSFLTTKPHVLELAAELGLEGELVATHPSRKTIYVYSGGRLLPLPDGLGLVPTRILPFVQSELLSWTGKLRVGLEFFIPAFEGKEDEPLAQFIRRRLGEEVLEKIAGPMLAGIYAGDPEQLSLQSTFPQLKEMEQRGGLLRAMRKQRFEPSVAGRSMFMTVKGGLSRLTETLALRLPARTVRTGASVSALKRRGTSWLAEASAGSFSADAVIAAVPANSLSGVVSELDFELSCALKEIPFASTATVSLVYEEKGFPDPLDGFGFLVPASEGRRILAATYTSTKFPGRVGPGEVLIRCFLGGAGRERDAEADEAEIARAAGEDLRDILKLGKRRPVTARVQRWVRANPQYNVGHALRLMRIESCLKDHPGLVLAGCSYYGVGLPDCVRSGREAAAKALRSMTDRSPAGVS